MNTMIRFFAVLTLVTASLSTSLRAAESRPNIVFLLADDLAAGYLNVMRHYGMIDGPAQYAPAWRMGFQIALLAPATGMFVGNPELPFETNIPAGTIIGQIYDLYGDVIGEVKAPREGVIFGLRSRPSVLEGQWCCFFGVIEQTVDNLIPKMT